MAAYPTEINHVKARGVVRITWDDGHIGEYNEPYLRGYCPCAMCQGHGSQRQFIVSARGEASRRFTVSAIMPSSSDGMMVTARESILSIICGRFVPVRPALGRTATASSSCRRRA